MKLLAVFLLGALIFASSLPVRVTRASLSAMEGRMDRSVESLSVDDPYTILGNTRGVYLEGYGAVFTAEVDVLASIAPSPFRPIQSGKADLIRIRTKKTEKILSLKHAMMNMLHATAWSLEGVPENEHLALAVTVHYFRYEDSKGMPQQIVMRAEKKALLKAPVGKLAGIEPVIAVQEF